MLARGVHVTDSKVLGDLLHILKVEERVEAGFICEIRMPVNHVPQLSLLPLYPAKLTSAPSVPSQQSTPVRLCTHPVSQGRPYRRHLSDWRTAGSQFHAEQKASCGYLLGFLVVHKIILSPQCCLLCTLSPQCCLLCTLSLYLSLMRKDTDLLLTLARVLLSC